MVAVKRRRVRWDVRPQSLTKRVKEQVDVNTECPICLEELNGPVAMLVCGHLICPTCGVASLDNTVLPRFKGSYWPETPSQYVVADNTSRLLKCPICRHACSGSLEKVLMVPPAHTLNQLKKGIGVDSMKTTCQWCLKDGKGSFQSACRHAISVCQHIKRRCYFCKGFYKHVKGWESHLQHDCKMIRCNPCEKFAGD